ncbi:pyridoxal phosphate-dependent decarboxylase family protein [Streptomyces huasconensis]|uniref:pyridoxal phosphate-dependent decarboxylase family protein n=1 Tax=Streptomyces huasconensis TaxID=1854574 RepID=UPI003700BEAE
MISTGRNAALAGRPEGLEQLRGLLDTVLGTLGDAALKRGGPLAPGGPQAAVAAVDEVLGGGRFLADEPSAQRVTELFEAYAAWAVDLTHPSAAARMQCAPTAASAAAELLAATLNQSLHAWESGPFALELERRLIQEMASLVGFGAEAGGTLTPGGSISNLMALLFSRDRALKDTGEVSATGLAGRQVRPRVLCSAAAHFSVARAAGFLGLGRSAVVKVPVDDRGRMIADEARRIVEGFDADEVPVAIVATAGTTDHGSFDPLPELADLAAEYGTWLHVDAAYGIGALFSPKLAPLLDGLGRADSVAFDLHKFGWTPASSSVVVVRDRRHMECLDEQAVYLNPSDDEALGFTALLGTSLQTTRRSDALKMAATFLTVGREGMGDWVEACHDQARYAASVIAATDGLELVADPLLTTVIFRCVPEEGTSVADENAWNAAVRRKLMADGRALLARTKITGPDGTPSVHLKLVFLNPTTTEDDIDTLLTDVTAAARETAGQGATRNQKTQN